MEGALRGDGGGGCMASAEGSAGEGDTGGESNIYSTVKA